MVERYARAWRGMTTAEKQAEALLAPWNAGGTYFSAFHPIRFYRTADVTLLGEKIFVGTVESVKQTKTGFVLTLQERSPIGEALWVWVQDVTFSHGLPGSALQTRLAAEVAKPGEMAGLQVFALERFSRQERNGHAWLSIPVVHPYMVWVG